MSNDISWLKKTKERLVDGDDLYLVIETLLQENKITFPQFVYETSQGISVTINEWLEYALDQDFDNPEEFEEVIFWFGGSESSRILPEYFIKLMSIITESYLEYYPEDKEAIHRNMAKLTKRYCEAK